MPRFVLLLHELPPDSGRATHWDLMLESGAVLLTWALEEPLRAGQPIRATRLADHRLAYLDYEGPVSKNRGQVSRVDAGAYEMISASADRIAAQLEGAKLRGELELTRDTNTGCWQVLLR